MASCPKCGKPRLGKDALKRRRCPKCGILRGQPGMCRSGVALPSTDDTDQTSATKASCSPKLTLVPGRHVVSPAGDYPEILKEIFTADDGREAR